MAGLVFLVQLLFGLALVDWKSSFAKEIPSFVVKCTQGDDRLVTPVISGYPPFNIEPLDPFVVKTLDFSTGGLKLVCKDVTFMGYRKAIVNKFNIDLSTMKLTLKVHVDTLEGTGRYKASGQILVLPIEGDGRTDVKINNLNIDMSYPFEIVNKDGNQHIRLKTVNYNYDILDSVHFHFEILFNGNKQLSEITHRFLNEHWKVVADELAPPIVRILFTKFTENMKNIFAEVPLNNFI